VSSVGVIEAAFVVDIEVTTGDVPVRRKVGKHGKIRAHMTMYGFGNEAA
jgi:hypothetical protein